MAECRWGPGDGERWTTTWYYCGEGDRQRWWFWDYGTGDGEYVSSLSTSANEYIEANDGQRGRCPWSVSWSGPWSTTTIHPTTPRNATTISTATVLESLSTTTPRTIPLSAGPLPSSSPAKSAIPIPSVPGTASISHTRLPDSSTAVPTTTIVADGVLCAAYDRRPTSYPL